MGPAAGAQQQPGVWRAVFMAVLAVDRFALRHAIILPVDSERHVAGGDEVHFDAGMGIVPDRAVSAIFDSSITAQLGVDAFEQGSEESRVGKEWSGCVDLGGRCIRNNKKRSR